MAKMTAKAQIKHWEDIARNYGWVPDPEGFDAMNMMVFLLTDEVRNRKTNERIVKRMMQQALRRNSGSSVDSGSTDCRLCFGTGGMMPKHDEDCAYELARLYFKEVKDG